MKATAREIATLVKTRRRWLKFAFIALIVLVFAGMFLARPLWHRWREHQAMSCAREARTAIDQQDLPRAMALAQEAARLAPRNGDVIRAVIDVQIGTSDHPGNIVQTVQRLIDLHLATSTDYLNLARAQLDRGDIPAVQTALNSVSEADRRTWRALEIETDLLLRLDRVPEAEAALHEALARQPGDEDVIFKLAVYDFTSGNDQRREVGRRVMWEVARSGKARAPLALNLLSTDRTLSAAEAMELHELATKQPGLTGLGLRYRATAALIRRRPHEHDRLLDAELEKAAALDASSQVVFLQFLAAMGESTRILDFINQHGASLRKQKPGDYWNFRLEGLARTSAWSQVLGEIKTAPAQSVPAVMLHLWQACAASEVSRNERLVQEHLERGFQAAGEGKDMAVAIQIADTAARLNQHELAAAYFEKIAANATMPADRASLFQRSLDSRLVLRDTNAAARLARQVADLTPGHQQNEFRATYLELLSGAAVEGVVTRLTQSETTDLPAAEAAHQRLLWAMIFLRRQQREMLPKELKGLAEATTWQAGERAVIAGLLAESGDTTAAFRLAEKVPQALLLKEEAAMLAKAK